MHGEPAKLFWRRRRLRLRPLVLILDVSGSMADYSRSLLQFAYSAKRAARAGRGVLLRHPADPDHPSLERRRLDDAMDAPAEAVFDWEGGTRIGDSLDTFVRDWGRRGVCRGGIVVICSDGLDRGDPRCWRRRWSGSPALSPGGLAEPAQAGQRRLPAKHPRHDGRRPVRGRVAVRPRPAQPGRVRRVAARAWDRIGGVIGSVRWPATRSRVRGCSPAGPRRRSRGVRDHVQAGRRPPSGTP